MPRAEFESRGFKGTMRIRIIRWLIFGVLIALLPLLFSLVSRRNDGQNFAVAAMLGRGELLLVIAGLCSAACGEIIGTGREWPALKIAAGGSALVILSLATSSYAHIATRIAGNFPVAVETICHDSLWLYAAGFLASAGCVVLAEVAP